MLAIDTAFFLLELSVGLYVGSLALMADAFHMVPQQTSDRDIPKLTGTAERHHIIVSRTLGSESSSKSFHRQVFLRRK